MTTPVFQSLKAIAKRLTMLFVGVVMFLSLTQTAVLAASRADAEPVRVPGITEPIPGENLAEMREQRREWQSKASALHENKNDESESLGEAIKDKLNIDELEQGHYDPERELEKSLERDPLGSR
ncbi:MULTISPECIES: hypothetical protein [unclassified Leptolyngbya]|uniref:hypothetical protein n=1 Tax=unclassified Leptolyngbya TaxID=2650499 RepID=UPI001685BF8D|nr:MULTISPECIES: hypothetical protein [unclassified Leptolyngbya]MBD1911666.1 hypothetical protein [Leptolyngbya sp. FACHB-8]MBD2154595.1 hypothetical protein [Leptolyngbya sp. FACHB-16]